MKIKSIKKILMDKGKRNIAIIGHMGSGKSSFGKKLSNYFSIQHFDTDRQIIEDQQSSIKSIFQDKGEEYFRKIESKIIKKIITKKNIIISLGGGSLINKENRKLINDFSYSIFLQVDLNILYKRLQYSRNRPLIINKDLNKVLKDLDKNRKEYYLKADLIIKNNYSIDNCFTNFLKIFD
tara:strand:+ start:23271 stop:23810 length:540 start_codon:yes stop_codon:yes gene_type:complete